MDILTAREKIVAKDWIFSDPHPIFGTISYLVKIMSIPGVFPDVHPHASAYHDATFSTKILVPKPASIAFSPRPEETLLVLTSRKLV